MAADDRGRIWFTELQFGKLGMIDATSGKITELKVPTTLGNPEDLHSIVVANDLGEALDVSRVIDSIAVYTAGAVPQS